MSKKGVSQRLRYCLKGQTPRLQWLETELCSQLAFVNQQGSCAYHSCSGSQKEGSITVNADHYSIWKRALEGSTLGNKYYNMEVKDDGSAHSSLARSSHMSHPPKRSKLLQSSRVIGGESQKHLLSSTKDTTYGINIQYTWFVSNQTIQKSYPVRASESKSMMSGWCRMVWIWLLLIFRPTEKQMIFALQQIYRVVEQGQGVQSTTIQKGKVADSYQS